MKKLIKICLVLLIIAGVLYVGYKLLTRDTEFDEFDEEYDLDSGKSCGLCDRVVNRVRGLFA